MATPIVPTQQEQERKQPRARIREVLPDVHLGFYKPGPLNAITDVPGVLVHTQELRLNNGAVNTGVTAILPRKDWFAGACYAGVARFNGAGEITGAHWLAETGLLTSPIVLTSTFAVGAGYQGIYEYAVARHPDGTDDGGKDGGIAGGIDSFLLPVVAETFDGWLSDMTCFAVTPAHVAASIAAARGGPVAEGCVGGGTGMICSGFKAGTGTSSRVVNGVRRKSDQNQTKNTESGPNQEPATEQEQESTTPYTVAALVQANYGRIRDLRIAGVPVGRLIDEERAREQQAAAAGGKQQSAEQVERDQQQAELERFKDKKDGSIIVVLATDAPLHPLQLQRLARRATVGLARAGGQGHNTSGDLFLAFSTANRVPVAVTGGPDPFEVAPLTVEVCDDRSINGLFEAAAEATEEAIYNSLCMAETMVGYQGRVAEALDLEKLKSIMERYR